MRALIDSEAAGLTSVERQYLLDGRHVAVLLQHVLGQHLLHLATVLVNEVRRQHRLRQRVDRCSARTRQLTQSTSQIENSVGLPGRLKFSKIHEF